MTTGQGAKCHGPHSPSALRISWRGLPIAFFLSPEKATEWRAHSSSQWTICQGLIPSNSVLHRICLVDNAGVNPGDTSHDTCSPGSRTGFGPTDPSADHRLRRTSPYGLPQGAVSLPTSAVQGADGRLRCHGSRGRLYQHAGPGHASRPLARGRRGRESQQPACRGG